MGKKKKVKADQRVSVKIGDVWTTIRIRLDIPTAKLQKQTRRRAAAPKKGGALKAATGPGKTAASSGPTKSRKKALKPPKPPAQPTATAASDTSAIATLGTES
jgi:hypothetical protein